MPVRCRVGYDTLFTAVEDAVDSAFMDHPDYVKYILKDAFWRDLSPSAQRFTAKDVLNGFAAVLIVPPCTPSHHKSLAMFFALMLSSLQGNAPKSQRRSHG